MKTIDAGRPKSPSLSWSLPLRMKIVLGFGGLIVLTVIVVVLSMRFGLPFTDYSGSFGSERSEALNTLSMVADLKAERLSLWLKERKGD